jgi:hypothetical protein
MVFGIDGDVSLAVRHGQTTAGRDRLYVMSQTPDHLCHGSTYARQMSVIDPGTDVHVNTDERQAITTNNLQGPWHVIDPDAVLAGGAAGIGLVSSLKDEVAVLRRGLK